MKTKPKNIIQRLCLFLLVLVLAAPTWAQGNEITIGSKEDWKMFCNRVNRGETNLNVKLTRDVNLETDIVMVGNIINMYSGTFDGQGHTLKFNWNAGYKSNIAPFQYVDGATIKNLRTQGKITTTGDGLSGMVLEVYGATTISNCVSDMDITGGSGWTPSNAAGMIRSVQTGASVTLTDCVVKGSLTDQANEGNRAMAGVVFTNMASCTQIRCLYLGTNNADNNGRSSTFVYNGDANTTLTDCYYLKPCGKVQGEKVTAERLKSGEMAKLLQGDRPEQVWGQTLGTDNEPLPTTDATKRVYEVKFNYNGNTVSRYATSGSTIFGGLPTAKELLGTAYDTGKTYTMTFDGGNFTAATPVTADKTVAVQITVQKNDFTIASAADWQTFCQRVNGGEPGLNAKLMQDVDLGEDIWMVGERNSYLGTFDGQGHTLKFNWNRSYKSNIAPFQYVDGATIKNLRTQGKITSRDGQYLSGLVFEAYGATTLTGCVSDVDITGGRGVVASGAAGMVQIVSDGASVQITDCLVKGSITDNAYADLRAMAGFVYDNSGTCTLTRCLYLGKNNAPANKNSSTFANGNATLTDCYYLYRCGQAQGKYVGESRLKSGEMAYLLQGVRTDNVWGQTLGTDNAPQLTAFATKAAKVYKVDFTYNGNTGSRYANGGQPIYGGLPTLQDILGKNYNAHHYYTQLSFGDGFTAATTISGDKTVSVTFTETDCVTIASKADWQTFREIVNSGQNGVDAKLTANVDLGTDIAMMGNGRSYRGIFDGQGHTLSFNWDAGSKENIAPFQFVEGATIRNLNVAGAIKSSGRTLSGLVGNALGTTTISNCVSDVNITSGHKTGACEVAGMIAYVNDYAEVDITDCVVKGTLNATENEGKKGMAGFVYFQTGRCTLTNCLYLGTSNVTDKGYTFADKATTLKNCYYLKPCGKAQGEQATKAQLESGYMAHLLQGMREETVWGQVLGTDTIPQLTAEAAKQVYEVKFTLNGKVKAMRYANRGGHVSLPTVQEFLGEAYNPANTYKLIFDGDFSASTPVNSDRTVAVVVAESYEIATKADWQAFCNRVNDGQTAINAKLMNDVDLSEKITMAGTIRNYNGTFDEQGHTLTLNWNSQSGEVAPFKFVNNATIKNLRVNGKIKSDGRTLSALVCNAVGNVTLSGCVSEVDITSNYHGVCELAGMIAYVNDRAEVAITDCVVKGAFNSMAADKKGMAGFVYLQTGYCTLTNCLYAGTNNATAGSYTFGSNTIRKNCYYLNPCGKAQGERIVEKQLESGEVAYKLQGDRTDSCHWAQVLGEWPGLYREADKAKPNYVYYNKDNNGWACDDFRLTDGQSLPIGLDFTATKATYDRTLAAGKATLCLPYELPVQGFRAYTLADRQESRTAVHFKEVNGTLGAYRPYLLVADGTLQLGGENLQVKADRSSIVLSAGNYYFKGAVQDVVNWWLASDHAYILQADGQFHKVTSNNPSVTVPAYRAYISYNSHEGAKPLSIVFDGETTGIYGTTDGATDGAADGAVYNLQGQRVADRLDDSVRRQIPTGVYIVNGRKVIVK